MLGKSQLIIHFQGFRDEILGAPLPPEKYALQSLSLFKMLAGLPVAPRYL